MRFGEVLFSEVNWGSELGGSKFYTEIKGGRGDSLIVEEEGGKKMTLGREEKITDKGKCSLNELFLLYEESLEKLELLCWKFPWWGAKLK